MSNQNLIKGVAKTFLGNFLVINDNASDIINSEKEKAIFFLSNKNIKGKYIGHNMFDKKKNEAVVIHFSNGSVRFSVKLTQKPFIFNVNVLDLEFKINKQQPIYW
jgi:hypothetical protein